jgi:DNA-binding transcriptional LysR family regulator
MKHGLALLQTMELLGGELADLRQGLSRHIRLCASTAAINQFLPPLLAQYAVLRPQVRVDVEEQVSGAVASTLREGRADVGIFVEGPDTTGLEVQAFRRRRAGAGAARRATGCAARRRLRSWTHWTRSGSA